MRTLAKGCIQTLGLLRLAIATIPSKYIVAYLKAKPIFICLFFLTKRLGHHAKNFQGIINENSARQ